MLRLGVPGSLVGAVARRAHPLTTISDTAASQVPRSRTRVRVRSLLFFGFAFAVMADPVSSVAYAIEAALRALHGHLDLLFVTMALVIGVIALVTTNYWFLVRRFPRGGGDAEAAGRAFGVAWAFPVIGALIVDFVLTISISISAASSAIIAYVPALAGWRILLALVLLVGVAGGTWFGHAGRVVFATFTTLFLLATGLVLAVGFVTPRGHGTSHVTGSASPALAAVILAFPVAMALATGVEAPLTSIAQLGQLDDDERRRFGRGTLLLTVGIVGVVTLLLTGLAVHLNVGIPGDDSTQIADIARAATGGGAGFALFQCASSILLLSAASSSYQAGPGLLKALARTSTGEGLGILPARLGRTNQHHTPYNAVLVYLVVSAVVILAAQAEEQELVLFYAVAVFASFLMGLLAMARFSRTEGNWPLLAVNCLAIASVVLTLAVNLARGYPLLSLAATAGVGGVLYALWARAGRPAGIEAIEQIP
jgi:hypothetical protein